MKIIYNKIIPFDGFLATNLFGILFIREEYKDKISPYVINHESIHSEQMKELGYIFFYIIYFFEWVIRLFCKGDAYKNLSFEREAYCNEYNLDYLKNRKRYSWLKYYYNKRYYIIYKLYE